MVDVERLKSGPATALHSALGDALERFMQDNHLSTREAGERLGIVHTNLASSRRYCLQGPDVLRALAHCEADDICLLAQAILERLRVPALEFDLEGVGNRLSPGVGLGNWRVANHREAANLLIQCFVRGAFFRDLALARVGGYRCTPVLPGTRFIETDYSFEPGDDPEAYCYEHYYGVGDGECRGGGRFLEIDTFDTERARYELTDQYLDLARRENLFLLEALEKLTEFRQAATESKDDLTAACAAVEAYVCYESLAAASCALRQSMYHDRLLAVTPLGRIAAALYEHARTNVDGVGLLCEVSVGRLPACRETARVALQERLRILLGTINAKWSVTDIAGGVRVSSLQR